MYSDSMKATEARKVINAAPFGRVSVDCELWGWLDRLLDAHPEAQEKRGPGVVGFSIRRNPRGKGRQTIAHRIDGTSTAFSWLKCCGAVSQRAQIDGAYRRAVKPQIAEVRRCAGYPADHHVDHVGAWTFARIVDAFEAEHGAIPYLELLEPDDGIGRELPPARAELFAAFHATRARLRCVAARENLSKAHSQRRQR